MLDRARAVPFALAAGVAALTFILYSRPFGLAGVFAGDPVGVISAEGGYRVAVHAEEAKPEEMALLEDNLWQRAAELSEHVSTSLEGTTVIVDMARVSRADAESYAELPEDGVALRMTIVADNSEVMQNLYREVSRTSPPGITAELDRWVYEVNGQMFEDAYLMADTRGELEEYVRAQSDPDLQVPDDLELSYEHVQREDYESGEPVDYWRTYVLEREQEFRPLIADAEVVFDSITNRPTVMLRFGRESGRNFARITGENLGRKLAIVVGDTITSAPTIQARIDGGSTQITMGGSDPQKVQREAERLVDALRRAPLPIPAETIGVEKLEPSASSAVLLARLIWALIAGVLVFFAGRLVVPRLRLQLEESSSSNDASALPWKRALVTLAGIAILITGSRVAVPGLDKEALATLTGVTGLQGQGLDIFAVGLLPFLSSWLLVELVCLLFSRTRRLRLSGPEGRGKIDRVAVALGTLLALAQSYFIAVWMEGIGYGGMGGFPGVVLVAEPGWGFRLLLMLTLTAGGLGLMGVARWISRSGIGNGIAVLLLAGSCIELWQAFSIPDMRYVDDAAGPSASGLIILAVVAAATYGLLHVRVSEKMARGGLRLPTSGVIPLSWAASLLMLASMAWQMGVHVPEFVFDVVAPENNIPQEIAIVVVVTIGLSLLFTRRSGATREQIAAATVVSCIFLVALVVAPHVVYAYGLLAPLPLVEVVLATAIALDLVVEFYSRLRRDDWVAIWPVQRIQLVDSIVERLRREGVEVFVRGVYLRSMLHLFGPFVSATLFVPEHDRRRALTIVAEAVRVPDALPSARAIASDS